MFKKFIKNTFLLSLIIVSTFLVGCNKSAEATGNEGYPLTITDSTGQSVTIDKEPQKVISLSPVITEIVAAVGAEEKLVGRTSFCDYPESAEKIEVIGDLITINVEKIIELKPDIVLGSAFIDDNSKKTLESAGIKVVTVYSEENLEGAYQDIATVGKILNNKAEADKVVKDMKAKVEEIKDLVTSTKNKPKAYYVVAFGAGGEFTATGDTFINELIEIAGGVNVAADGQNWSYSLEKIIEKNPDMIIYSNMLLKEELIKSNGYKDLSAVKSGKVYEIDSSLLERTGPRLAEGLEELTKIIHPELFK